MMKGFTLAFGIICLGFNLMVVDAWSSKSSPNHFKISRRDFAKWTVASTTSLLLPLPSIAEEVESEAQGLVSASDLADLLRPVPTFTIVDKKGVPFMVVGEDAKITGYFFTTYNEAYRILDAAKKSADKAIKEAKKEGKTAEEAGENPWKSARVSSVPLDFAVTLVSKSGASARGGFYFKVAPAEDDIEDALVITGEEDLAEGKVPLFYFPDFMVEKDGKKKTPLFFRESELKKEFKRLNPSEKTPDVMVTELFAVLSEMLRPGGIDNDLRSLYFVAPKESEKKQKACEKAGGEEPPFFLGQRIIVL